MSENREDNNKTVGDRAGDAIDTSVSFLDNMWENHATKIVLVILLVCLALWYYGREVTDTVSAGMETVTDAVTGVFSGEESVLPDSTEVANGLQPLAPQLDSVDLDVTDVAEIRNLFNL